ncbi:hypothetical protein BJ912DRAFT_1050251 [Pholiota molesta]|nr:hypothetical protein BJ912DRAFT_1050251 [Pholiota molesta]
MSGWCSHLANFNGMIDIIFGFPASIVLSRYIWISREQRGSIYSGFPRDCFKQCYHLYKFRIITRFVQIQLAVITDIAGNLCCACKSFSSTICLDFRAIVSHDFLSQNHRKRTNLAPSGLLQSTYVRGFSGLALRRALNAIRT